MLSSMSRVGNDQPTVSVLLPVFNERPDFLEQAINSILSQTFQGFELVIMDDGSDQEATIQVLNSYQERDGRVRSYSGPHCGYTKMLNVGLSLCRGEFICRHDSDDWSEPTRIERQVLFLQQNPSRGLVGSNVALHQENGRPLWISNLPLESKDIMAAFPHANPFCHGSVCLRKAAIEAVSGYREELETAEDYDLFWRICEHSGGSNLPEVLYHLRRTAGSVTATRGWEMIKKFHTVQRLAEMRRQGIPEDFDLATREVEAKMAPESSWLCVLNQGDRLMLAGHYRRALLLFLRGVAMRPFRALAYLRLLRLTAFTLLPPVRKRLFKIQL